MSAEVFLDTNVLVYAFSTVAAQKRALARDLLGRADWVVSWQVIQEFGHIALKKFPVPMTPGDLEDYLALVLWPKCRVLPSLEIYRSACMIHRQTQYRFLDSLIVAGALAAGVPTLYTEDMQHGRKIGDLRILNPFLETGD